MRHLRVLASILGYTAIVITIFRAIPFSVISDERFLNSIVEYYFVAAVFLVIIFLKGLDTLEYFRLPERSAHSFAALTVAAILVSPQFFAGHNEMKPWSTAIPGVIFLFGIGFGEEFFARGLCFGMLRKYGQRNAIIFSSVIFGLLHLNLYTGKNWDLWLAYGHVISAGFFGVIAAQVMIMTKSIWMAVIFHALSDWHIVFERVIKDDGTETFPPYTLFDNIFNPWMPLFFYGPFILFLARVNRGGWPKWIEKLALRFKLVHPVGAID